MKCRNYQNRLSAYLDGVLPLREKPGIERHLQTCGDCSRILADMETAWALLGALPEPKPAPFLATRVLAELHETHSPRIRHWIEQILIPVSATAVVALGIWLGSLAGRNGEAILENGSTEDPVVLSYADHLDDFPAASISDAYFNLNTQE